MEDELYINDIGEEVAVNPEEANTETEQEAKVAESALNQYQRAQERKAKFNQFGENFAKWWEAYNGASTPTVADAKKPAENTTVATQDFGNVGEGATIEQTDGVGASGASVGSATNGGATDATSLSFLEQKMANNAASKATKAQLLRDYNKAREDGLGAYEALMRSALANKQAIAERKERDARSKAFTNALGTLVGAFTSHGMAKRGGYVPIVNAHDVEPDNAFRKSVEERYALENENENLLLQLAQERRKYEDDLAKSLYEKGVADVDAETKIKNDAIDSAEKRANAIEDMEAKHNNAIDLVNRKVDLGVYDVDNTGKSERVRQLQDKPTTAEKGVAAKLWRGKQEVGVSTDNRGKSSANVKGAKMGDADESALVDFYRKSKLNRGLTNGIEDKWISVWNNLFTDDEYSYLFGNTEVDREVIDMLKNQAKSAEDVISTIKNKYPKAE